MQFTYAVGRVLSLVVAILTPVMSFAAQTSSDLEKRVGQLEKVQVTGSYRLNYTVQDWNDEQKARGGDFRFNQINLGAETEKNGVRLSSQYRWYDGVSMVHHLYFASNIDAQSEVQVGITKVPFGIQPYESHNDWGDNALFMGFNDDYDAGIKYITQRGAFNVQVAYFSNGDVSPSNATRFSADVVSTPLDENATNGATRQANEEAHQFNFHTSYKIGDSELGASAQLTGLYNSQTDKMGHAWAAAVFLNGRYGSFGTQLQAGRYEYNPENQTSDMDESIQMGAFGVTYLVAAKANAYVANLHYDLPYHGGIVDLVRVYSDYDLIDKDEASFKDSHIHTVGMMIVTGDLYTFVDITSGKNALFVGDGSATTALAQGDGTDEWNRFLNIQFGYYF